MKVLVRQISTGLYWNSKTGWVQAQDAEAFANSSDAIQHCTSRDMRDVHVILRFGDPRYDLALHPFGEAGHEPSSKELIEQSRDLLAATHQTIAEAKERKKRRPSKGNDGRNGPVPV